MQATERAARSQYEMAKRGAQIEDKDAAAAMVEVAKSGVAQVESVLADSYLTAPIDGEISGYFPECWRISWTRGSYYERFRFK